MQNPWDKEFLESLECTEGTALPSSPPRLLPVPPIVPSAPSLAAEQFQFLAAVLCSHSLVALEPLGIVRG